MRLAFVLTDFYLPDELPLPVPAPLAALANALRFAGKRKLPGDWRDWLVTKAGAASQEQQPVTSLAAQLWSAPRRPQTCWFADPVHCRPTLDRVQLAPDGCLRLDADDTAELLARFGRDFAGSGWQLADAGDGRLLLGLDRAVGAVDTVSPQRWLGRDIAAALPRGPGAAVLRAVSAEIEMWLFGSPLNRQRQIKGLPPVTQLWLWDRSCSSQWLAADTGIAAAHGGERPGRSAPLRLLANDLFAKRLAQARGLAIGSDSPDLPSLLGSPAATTIVLQPVYETGGHSLREFVAHQIEPAVGAVRAGRLSQLTVIANDSEYRLDRLRLLRFWRARRGAHQVLLS